MTGYEDLLQGEVTQVIETPCQDEDCSMADFLRKDVTGQVRTLVRAYEASLNAVRRLTKELDDIKTRKWWDELDVVTDPRTGNKAVVRTHYQLEMKGLRLEFLPESLPRL